MLERRSALAEAKPYRRAVLKIEEKRGFTLTQVAAPEDAFEAKLSGLAGALPDKVVVAQESDGRTLLRIGPSQFWIIGPEIDDTASRLHGLCAVTPLSHSRVRIAIEGPPAREVLAKLMPLDFHASVFTPGKFAMTGLHHTPVTVHCTGPESFDIYAMRTFALNIWEVITDAALEYC